MKVRKLTSVSLTICEFDDNEKWVHVDVQVTGQPARTVYQSNTESTLSSRDLDLALAYLDDLSQTWVNRYRAEQTALF